MEIGFSSPVFYLPACVACLVKDSTSSIKVINVSCGLNHNIVFDRKCLLCLFQLDMWPSTHTEKK